MNDSFTQRVYALVAQIPAGEVATYQDIAILAGSPKAVRAVGMAMARNPDAKRVPCHRVIGSDGRMHGYAFGNGIPRKMTLLREEGIEFIGNKVDLTRFRWKTPE